MSKLVILFVCLAVLQASTALKCKKCDGDCSKPEDETCQTPGASQKVGCLTEVYTDNASSKKMEVKKCVLYDKSITKYSCIPTPNTKQETCEVCESGDNCNSSAASIGLNFVAFAGIAMALLVPKLM